MVFMVLRPFCKVVDVLPYLKTDHALYAAMGDTHKRYRLDMEHNNWWECFVYTPEGKFHDMMWALDSDHIFEGVEVEYPVIIVPLLKEHYIMLRRNLLYTAVTRAKAKVILIGQKQAVFVAIHKCDVGQRNTVLADRIVAYYNRELSRRVA